MHSPVLLITGRRVPNYCCSLTSCDEVSNDLFLQSVSLLHWHCTSGLISAQNLMTEWIFCCWRNRPSVTSNKLDIILEETCLVRWGKQQQSLKRSIFGCWGDAIDISVLSIYGSYRQMGNSAHCSWVNHQKNDNLLYQRYCIKWSHIVILEGCLGWDQDILQCNATQGRDLNVSRAVGWEEQVELAGAFEPVPFPPMTGTWPDTSWSGNYLSAHCWHFASLSLWALSPSCVMGHLSTWDNCSWVLSVSSLHPSDPEKGFRLIFLCV